MKRKEERKEKGKKEREKEGDEERGKEESQIEIPKAKCNLQKNRFLFSFFLFRS